MGKFASSHLTGNSNLRKGRTTKVNRLPCKDETTRITLLSY